MYNCYCHFVSTLTYDSISHENKLFSFASVACSLKGIQCFGKGGGTSLSKSKHWQTKESRAKAILLKATVNASILLNKKLSSERFFNQLSSRSTVRAFLIKKFTSENRYQKRAQDLHSCNMSRVK